MFGNLLEGNTSERNLWSRKSFWDLKCAMRCSIDEGNVPGIPFDCRIFPLNTAVYNFASSKQRVLHIEFC